MVVTFVKPFSPILKDKAVNIYNTIFKIHTKYTPLLLLIFYCLVSAREFFGNPIHCLLDDKDLKPYVENVCWSIGTFTSKYVHTSSYPFIKFEEKKISSVDSLPTIQSVTEHQKYYQWIVVVLLLQSILFYAPAYLWKVWEHGRLKKLCSTLVCAVIDSDYQDKKKQLVDYLKSNNHREHSTYFIRFFLCEILNFLNVIANMWLLDVMFGQFWTRYFPAVSALIQMDGELFASRATEIFPKLVKCDYTNFGPSGSNQYRDAKCLLSQNVLNEKIFAFLYIWFMFLLFLSGCNLIFRFMTLTSSKMRLLIIRALVMSSIRTTRINIETIMRDEKIGNWFILFEIGRNINRIVFEEVLDELANIKRIQLNENDDI